MSSGILLMLLTNILIFFFYQLTKRSVQSLDVLNLDQIRMLSDKALVHMFSEMTANEMTRNYTYTCFLVPDKCQATFTSFGNESRARMRLRAHLLEHIGELLQEENGMFYSILFICITGFPLYFKIF